MNWAEPLGISTSCDCKYYVSCGVVYSTWLRVYQVAIGNDIKWSCTYKIALSTLATSKIKSLAYPAEFVCLL